ncbi:hypothetical protein NU118_003336 [Salmonella enterica]|nr:hypothetical protein [Salmonella enterica]EIG0992138.1 hypothetical protein [Salmonella enterica]EIX9960490.1 hypothetical protein [Salmonella enterica]EJP2998839.1 hypothetical protein [Salmonella enterica]EKI4847623.1 hypothetical protein [Salmonella enterica]
MSETNITESVPARGKRSRWSRRSAVVTCLCLTMLAAGFVLYVLVSGVTDLDTRLSRLEAQDNTATTTETLSTLQSQISTLQAGLANNQQRVATLQKEAEARTGSSQELASLQASAARLQQAQQEMAARLNALAEQLNALKAVPAAATPAPEKTPTDVKKLLPVKPRPKAVVAHHAPFVLTGVERRGTESWAAVAPRGYHSLSQIALIGEGETVSGWTLVRAGYSEATFRVNGRLTALKVE